MKREDINSLINKACDSARLLEKQGYWEEAKPIRELISLVDSLYIQHHMLELQAKSHKSLEEPSNNFVDSKE